jgi:hypothetical protein
MNAADVVDDGAVSGSEITEHPDLRRYAAGWGRHIVPVARDPS